MACTFQDYTLTIIYSFLFSTFFSSLRLSDPLYRKSLSLVLYCLYGVLLRLDSMKFAFTKQHVTLSVLLWLVIIRLLSKSYCTCV